MGKLFMYMSHINNSTEWTVWTLITVYSCKEHIAQCIYAHINNNSCPPTAAWIIMPPAHLKSHMQTLLPYKDLKIENHYPSQLSLSISSYRELLSLEESEELCEILACNSHCFYQLLLRLVEKCCKWMMKNMILLCLLWKRMSSGSTLEGESYHFLHTHYVYMYVYAVPKGLNFVSSSHNTAVVAAFISLRASVTVKDGSSMTAGFSPTTHSIRL